MNNYCIFIYNQNEFKMIYMSLLMLIATLFSSSAPQEADVFNTSEYLDFAMQQVGKTLNVSFDPDYTPRYIKPGDTAWSTSNPNDWTSGFWPGILWYMYEYSQDPHIREMAHNWAMPIEKAKNRVRPNHDLCFMVFNSFGHGYRLTGKDEYLPIILETADSLAVWFNPKAGTILSWLWARETYGWSHNTIIDNMMNLELLFWAARNGGDKDTMILL